MVCDRRYYLQLAIASRRCRAIPKVLVRYRQNEGGVTSVFTSSGRLQEEMIVFANDAENLFRGHPRGGELARRLRVSDGEGSVSCLVWKLFWPAIARAEKNG